MVLTTWAKRWGVPPEALSDLKQIVGVFNYVPPASKAQSEAGNQQDIRLAYARVGVPLWRNNVGAVMTDTGGMVRYGLANDSKAVNTQIKSGDLIGITPHMIRPEDVGLTLGVFTSIEVKRSNWRYTGTPRENAQLNWALLVISLGGKACFSSGAPAP